MRLEYASRVLQQSSLSKEVVWAAMWAFGKLGLSAQSCYMLLLCLPCNDRAGCIQQRIPSNHLSRMLQSVCQLWDSSTSLLPNICALTELHGFYEL